MSNRFVEEAKTFYQQLINAAVVIFDNNDRSNGITEMYTSGRNPDGCLNGKIITSDIKTMIRMGEKHCDMHFDTFVVPVAIWTELLRQPAFGELLYGSLTIVPTEQLAMDATYNTSSVLLLNSRDLTQVVVAKAIKFI